jgi:hypothetical protein
LTAAGPASEFEILPSNEWSDRILSLTQDEITTIFVVGFPDDMMEREFQNMFTFSAGFEAASLKVPSDVDDHTKKQIVCDIDSDWLCKV